jgi:hypothetical protein
VTLGDPEGGEYQATCTPPSPFNIAAGGKVSFDCTYQLSSEAPAGTYTIHGELTGPGVSDEADASFPVEPIVTVDSIGAQPAKITFAKFADPGKGVKVNPNKLLNMDTAARVVNNYFVLRDPNGQEVDTKTLLNVTLRPGGVANLSGQVGFVEKVDVAGFYQIETTAKDHGTGEDLDSETASFEVTPWSRQERAEAGCQQNGGVVFDLSLYTVGLLECFRKAGIKATVFIVTEDSLDNKLEFLAGQ